MTKRVVSLLSLAVLVAALTSCASRKMSNQARLSEQLGDWDEAVVLYLELSQKEPASLSHRAALLRAKVQASHFHFGNAQQYREAGVFGRALVELQEAVQLDPTNQYAFVELQKVRAELAAQREEYDRETSLDTIKERTRGALALPPVLDPRSDEPIDLDFPEPVSIMDIYRALGKAFGINVLFDPKLRDEEISIELKQVTAQDALEILIRTAGHFYKVVDEHSIIIVADTTQNRRAYTDLIIQTFFLSNAEVADIMTMLRTLIDSRKIAPNERLNAISLRDSADKVKVAERLIRSNDKARAEVVVDVELMQIDTNKLREIGLSLDPRQISFSLDDPTTASGTETSGGGGIRFSDLEFINASSWFVTIPSFLIDFVRDKTEAQTLARPQLRISDGETASLVIADQIPIPVTRFNTSNTVGGSIVPVTSFQYQDVGITIEIEPRVHHNNEISLKVRVVVSNIAGSIGDQPIIGTREINTTIRLKDGETNFLAGLIRTDRSVSEEGIAGLSEIPLFGRLFSKRTTQNKRTDIVLTLTPHIIRRADITEEDLRPIWVGTETNFSFNGGSPRLESPADGPFDNAEERERALERRRQRLQELPRGLRGRQPDTPDEPEVPLGVDLVPSSRPNPPAAAASSFRLPSLPGTAPDLRPMEAEEVTESFSARQGSVDAARRALPSEPEGPGGVEMFLSPDHTVVRPGEIFEVSVRVDAAEPVAHLPFTLAFDGELLEVLDTERGGFLGTGGSVQLLADTSRPGQAVIGASLLGRAPGVRGLGEIYRIRFRALRQGEGNITFIRSSALDSLLEGVELRTRSSRVVVQAPAATPYPALPERPWKVPEERFPEGILEPLSE